MFSVLSACYVQHCDSSGNCDVFQFQTNPASNCSSPSSDKENASEDCKEGSPKKWTLPKVEKL